MAGLDTHILLMFRAASLLARQVDESIAFGALPGPNGRGACDYLGIPPQEVDMLTASLGTSLGSVGGFCAGEHQVIEHQRINASGYCFSASLPPYLSAGALASLELIRSQPQIRCDLVGCVLHGAARLNRDCARSAGAFDCLPACGRENEPGVSLRVRRRDNLAANAAALRAAVAALPGAEVSGDKNSPLIHVRLAPGATSAADSQGRRDSGGAATARAIGDGGVLTEAAQEVGLETRHHHFRGPLVNATHGLSATCWWQTAGSNPLTVVAPRVYRSNAGSAAESM